MAGTANLNSEAIRSSSYRYRTEGYEDVYGTPETGKADAACLKYLQSPVWRNKTAD